MRSLKSLSQDRATVPTPFWNVARQIARGKAPTDQVVASALNEAGRGRADLERAAKLARQFGGCATDLGLEQLFTNKGEVTFAGGAL